MCFKINWKNWNNWNNTYLFPFKRLIIRELLCCCAWQLKLEIPVILLIFRFLLYVSGFRTPILLVFPCQFSSNRLSLDGRLKSFLGRNISLLPPCSLFVSSLLA